MTIRIRIRPAVLALVILLAGCASETAVNTLTILHTNDIHSRLLPVNALGSLCGEKDEQEGKCLGGSARLAAAIADERVRVKAAGGAAIVLDGGDQFQGSLFYTQYRGQAEMQVMNRIGYDAMVIGNHEFDNGPPVLAEFLKGARFPVISANTDASGEPLLAGRFRPYTILDTRAGRIGIIGGTTEDTPTMSSSGPSVSFRTVEDAVTPIVAELNAKGIDRIILVTHIGLSRDREVARRVAGIDVIVGGHSHTLLSNASGAAGAGGPYPVVERGPTGDPVLIVQTGAFGRFLGRIDVTFDATGRVSAWSGDTILLSQSMREDPEVKALVAKLGEPLEQLRRTPVGQAAADFDQRACRMRECEIGNLVAGAMLEAMRSQGVVAAITNGGGLRAGLPAGPITLGDVLTVLPFQNTVATLKLTGADLAAALEHGLGVVEQGGGRFPQVAGIRYRFDPKRPAGQRLLGVEIQEPDGGPYRSLDPARLYKIATNDFMRRGGDAYAILRDKAIEPYDFGPNLEEIAADFIRRNSPVRPLLDGRVGQP